MKARLLEQAAGKLAGQVVSKVRRLAGVSRAKEPVPAAPAMAPGS